VADARARLEQLSLFDPLTGLYNYRYLHARLNEEFKRAERYHEPLACMVVDIDNLRAKNQGPEGRAGGDKAICQVADALRKSVREVDVVARFGADEFLVLLPSTHFAGATTVAERLFHELREATEAPGQDAISLSVGIALYPSRDVRSKDQLLRAADAAMHHAKREGTGRISVYQQQGQLYTPLLDVSSRMPRATGTPPRVPRATPSSPPERGPE
jgi:diguanylate cyclase (GGDEF)-like protein